MPTIDLKMARRLALARAGLLKPDWTGFPRRAADKTKRARKAALKVIERFGYLQLDTVSIAGARSHAIVLMSRLEGFQPDLAEELLQPGEPLFEYWGHEASWIPMEFYPLFEFRRHAFHEHPWWGDIIGKHPQVATQLLKRIRDEGPLRSMEMEGRGSRGWWDLKIAKRVATALWSDGRLAIRERRNFQRYYDLRERVIPAKWRGPGVGKQKAIQALLQLALRGHGWAQTGTLAKTFRLHIRADDVQGALHRLKDTGRILPCELMLTKKQKLAGWIRPKDLELAARLRRVRPHRESGVLLSPFDPLLWDRSRVERLFDFDQILEIFKPAAKRRYGYYCLPVLAGERLIARLDLKADRRRGRLAVLSLRYESKGSKRPSAIDRKAVDSGLQRFSDALGLKPTGANVS
ncbi:MAG: crosslink repair DNA glycosylase YcaQ family protein [Desulfosarcinaceae bacterium]|nr:crosslink repair DNA glycosylase YcaQ family protein [Desulfosarcinaceae bacterium]